MTDTQAAVEVSGQMFLYEKPELLSKEVHGSMGFSPVERPFDFVREVRAIPLTTMEFGASLRNYPIIFSNMENPMPLAILGIAENENMFVGEDGKWDPLGYVPMYLRCHPFAFATEEEGRMAVVVDTAAATVTSTPQYPFFVDGEVSEQTDSMMRACARYEQERNRTQEFCKKLVELKLLAPLRAAHTPEGETEPQPLADYVGVNVELVNELPADVVYDLHKSGFLSAIYLHLHSLENWRHLVARKVAKLQGKA
jgi:hypothetical protein